MTKNSDSINSQWWTVALSEEVIADKPFAAMCAGSEFVLFRDKAGTVLALLDQCAHRRAPLSLGHITASGHIECPYHGWRYDGGTGSCVAIPNFSIGERVPPAYQVPAFAVIEQDGFVHLWTQGTGGDKAAINSLVHAPQESAFHGSTLLAYPFAEWVDLLLDAPGAVLDIAGVTVIDRHRYGEPKIESSADSISEEDVVVGHAAMWRSQRKPSPQNVIADYPLAVRVAVAANGHSARVDVRTNAGELLASAAIAMTPVKPTLTRVLWRGEAGRNGARPIQIGVRTQLQAEAIKSAFAYPSLIRRELAQAKHAPVGVAKE